MTSTGTTAQRVQPRSPRIRIAPPSLRRALEKFSNRAWWLGLSGTLLWGGVSFVLTLLLWMWCDVIFALSPVMRLFAWFTALVVAVVVIVKGFVTVFRRTRLEQIATQLDRTGKTGGEIRSALDLWRLRKSRSTIATVTEGLAELAVRRASKSAGRLSDEQVYPLTPLMRPCMVAAGLFLLTVVLGIAVPRMATTELARFFLPYRDTPAWSLYQFVVTPQDTEVVYSESVELSAEVFGPAIESVEMVLIPPQDTRQGTAEDVTPIDVLPMFPDHLGVWHASVGNITEPFDYFLRVRRARSRVFHVDVITVPEIREIEVELTPPLYTGHPPFRGPVTVDGLAGLQGTRVRWTTKSNRPLSGGVLTFRSESGIDEYPLVPESDPRQVSGEFQISSFGQLELTITDESGQASIEEYSTPVRLLEDQHPLVRLIQPQAISLATPTVTLPVIVSAEDDYGVQKCELYRSLNDSRFLPTTLPLPSGIPRRVELPTELPLASYGLRPGDVIKLFARVEDNDPQGIEPGVGKGAESSVVTVLIVSEQELNRMQQQRDGLDMLMNKYAQAQRRLENVAEQVQKLLDELQDLPPDSELAQQLRDKLDALSEQMRNEAEMIRKLADQNLPLDIDEQLSPELRELAETLRKMAEQTRQAAENPELTNEQLQQQLTQLQQQLQQEQQAHEQQRMQPLEMLKQVMPLRQDEQAFTQLVQRQKQLADRLSALRDFDADDDPSKRAQLRELEDRQRDLRHELEELLDKIQEDAERLDENEEQLDTLRQTAKEFVQSLRNSGALEEMVNAEEGMGQFSGQRGYEGARNAAKILEQFLSQAGQMGQQASEALGGFAPGGLGQSLQQTLEQLSQGNGQMPGQMRLGGGTGGQSSRTNSLENVGMYGGNPLHEPTQSRYGQSDQYAPTGSIPGQLAAEGNQSGNGLRSSQSNPAYGGADWGVPLRYQRQAGRYLQQLAEELE